MMFDFDPTPFEDLFNIEGDRIYYLKALRTGTPRSYVWADPEEKVRAWFYARLVNELKYPAERIDLEVVVGRRSPVDFADIVVYRDDALTERFLVVECKAPNENFEQAISQAWGNANNLGAQFACTTNGTETVCFDPRTFDPGDPERRYVGLPERYGEPIVFERIKGDEVRDLRPATQAELNAKFRTCHDILWAGGRRNPAEAFDEMTKLIFCKLQDERHGTADGEPYRFQVGSNETPTEVAARVKAIWADFRAVAQPVFGRAIEVPDDLIYRVVQSLQNLSLSRSDLDAKGKAFEMFLPTVFRGQMGQFFTPRPVVRFMVDLLQPSRRDKIIDPACGSGGFLLFALESMQRFAADRFRDPVQRREFWLEWAQTGLFGIEINDQISRVAMMGMILHEDGRSNVACHDALSPFGASSPGFYRPGTFTMILTNPPFGASVSRSVKRAPHATLDAFTLGRGRQTQKTEVLFIERCLELLAPGGRMAIIIPDSVLNTTKRADLRQYVEDRAFIDAVISLPVETFMFSAATVKSSVLVLRKFTEEEVKKIAKLRKEGASREEIRAALDYRIFVAHAESVGITATGVDCPDELPAIAEAYRNFRKMNPLEFGSIA